MHKVDEYNRSRESSTDPDVASLSIESTDEHKQCENQQNDNKQNENKQKENKKVRPSAAGIEKRLAFEKARQTDTTLFMEDEPLCFVIGYGIDTSHSEFAKDQILELVNSPDSEPGSLPILQKSTYVMPKDLLKNDKAKRFLTHDMKVASIIGGKTCGVAAGTKIVDVRVDINIDPETKAPSSEPPGFKGALERVKMYLEQNPNVLAIVNISYGDDSICNTLGLKCNTAQQWKYPKTITRNSDLDPLLNEITQLGALIVTAVGNCCVPAYTSWPASNPNVLSVGALDKHGNKYAINNTGAGVHLYAFGVDVDAAVMPPDNIEKIHGTSHAAPYISGCACKVIKKAIKEESGRDWLYNANLRPGALKDILYAAYEVEQKNKKPNSDALEVDIYFDESNNAAHDQNQGKRENDEAGEEGKGEDGGKGKGKSKGEDADDEDQRKGVKKEVGYV